jgi:hypothetical protein
MYIVCCSNARASSALSLFRLDVLRFSHPSTPFVVQNELFNCRWGTGLSRLCGLNFVRREEGWQHDPHFDHTFFHEEGLLTE